MFNEFKFFRKTIIDNDEDKLLNTLTQSEDFYSTSAVRDLLFHVQEHRFTIPQISEILINFKLEFLGFIYLIPQLKMNTQKFFLMTKRIFY